MKTASDPLGFSKRGAWQDLLQCFAKASLPAPPIPKEFQPKLMKHGPWCWSTVPIDPLAMYFLEPAVSKLDEKRSYAAVSHAGHGVNSYGLNVYLITDAVAVYIQFGWGGVYMDTAEVTSRIAEGFVLLRDLLVCAGPQERTKNAVIAFSDFRRVATFGRRRHAHPFPSSIEKDGAWNDDKLSALFGQAALELCRPAKLTQALRRAVESFERIRSNK